jgi:glutathione S-transferase
VLLYSSPVSGNCYKVRLLLAHVGLEYETVDVSVVDRSNRAALLADLNPGLRLPTIVLDDGRPLAESNAILGYFGDGTRYVPEDSYERAGAAVAVLRAVVITRNTRRALARARSRRRGILIVRDQSLGAGRLPGGAKRRRGID